MGRVSTCQKNCNTIDLRRAQVNYKYWINKVKIFINHGKIYAAECFGNSIELIMQQRPW